MSPDFVKWACHWARKGTTLWLLSNTLLKKHAMQKQGFQHLQTYDSYGFIG
jgi:hypothetical protein